MLSGKAVERAMESRRYCISPRVFAVHTLSLGGEWSAVGEVGADDAAGGNGLGGVFGPVVFGVAATEVLADDGVAVGPEAGKVGGHLDGTLGGGEQVEEKRHAAFGQARGGLEAEDLLDTDGDGSFPSGDAFLVYPGGNGPVNSIRMEVLREAFQDYSALCLLESLVGREEAMKLLEEGIPPLTFQQYPQEKEWLLGMRGRINEKIKDALYTYGSVF